MEDMLIGIIVLCSSKGMCLYRMPKSQMRVHKNS